MRIVLTVATLLLALMAAAQTPAVAYLEKVGNGGTRVFAVTNEGKDEEVENAVGKAKLNPREQACLAVINAILFDGVEYYNNGAPLVDNPNDTFARSLINPKTKAFMTYCKEVTTENSPKNKKAHHYIVEVNHFNLLRLLHMRGSRPDLPVD